jgi:hypothetical protein
MPSNAWQMIPVGHRCPMVNSLQQRSIATGQTGNKRNVLKLCGKGFGASCRNGTGLDYLDRDIGGTIEG